MHVWLGQAGLVVVHLVELNISSSVGELISVNFAWVLCGCGSEDNNTLIRLDAVLKITEIVLEEEVASDISDGGKLLVLSEDLILSSTGMSLDLLGGSG
jgi:hypothetical protein